MPPKKGGNEKKESGRAKKAENETKKAQASTSNAEKKEAEKWQDGVKTKKAKDVEKEEKKAADAAKKAEVARLLAEEEASISSSVKPKQTSKGKKKAATPAGPGAIATGGISDETPIAAGSEPKDSIHAEPETFAATGLDNALEMLSLVTAKTDKASIGREAAGLESHPERRFKAAFEAYKEKELPELKVERPGLRLQQYHEILYKQFQKSPENPFNQQTVAYDASNEEKVDILTKQKERTANRFRQA